MLIGGFQLPPPVGGFDGMGRGGGQMPGITMDMYPRTPVGGGGGRHLIGPVHAPMQMGPGGLVPLGFGGGPPPSGGGPQGFGGGSRRITGMGSRSRHTGASQGPFGQMGVQAGGGGRSRRRRRD